MTWTRVMVTARYDSHLSPLADVDCPVSRARGRRHGRPRWTFQPDTEAQRAALERALAGVAAPRGPARVMYFDGPKLPLIGLAPADQEGLDLPEFHIEVTPEEGIGPVVEWGDEPWRGNETEAAEMNRGASYVRKVLEATSEPAQGGLITKWTYKLEDGHTVTRYLINSAKPHQRAACDTCKAAQPQTPEERREERDRMESKGFGKEREE